MDSLWELSLPALPCSGDPWMGISGHAKSQCSSNSNSSSMSMRGMVT